ncbi:transposase, partial [Mycobacterium tuberculosis TKK-01-0019]
MRWGVESICTQ